MFYLFFLQERRGLGYWLFHRHDPRPELWGVRLFGVLVHPHLMITSRLIIQIWNNKFYVSPLRGEMS